MNRRRNKRIRVAVLLGGLSSEREVSFQSGRQVLKHLPEEYQGIPYDPKKDIAKLVSDAKAKKLDVVFNALHGAYGEDGRMQGMLDVLGIPYTGSGVLASALALDKAMAKRVYSSAGIPSPKAIQVMKSHWKRHKKELLNMIKADLGPNVVIKPNASGSSVAISVRPKVKDFEKAIGKALREDGVSCLVEAFHKGRELTVGILEKNGEPYALPVIEIRTSREFFDYKAKYQGQSEEICPAPIPDGIRDAAQRLAIDAHISLGCKAYSRTDIIWAKDGLFVLETNTLPGLTSASLLPQAAKADGMTFPMLIDRLIREALVK